MGTPKIRRFRRQRVNHSIQGLCRRANRPVRDSRNSSSLDWTCGAKGAVLGDQAAGFSAVESFIEKVTRRMAVAHEASELARRWSEIEPSWRLLMLQRLVTRIDVRRAMRSTSPSGPRPSRTSSTATSVQCGKTQAMRIRAPSSFLSQPGSARRHGNQAPYRGSRRRAAV
jgi:hypothetical protein